jgi:alpha-amylase
MLAWPYGFVKLMSSYNFSIDNRDQGPPADENGETLNVGINKDGSCGNGWICEHRWIQIVNMVKFRNVVSFEPVQNWYDNQSNQIAFSRGSKGRLYFKFNYIQLS